MHLKSMTLKGFKGFTNLTLDDIPATARLVMLIGPNGTGKSSIFDALMIWSAAYGKLSIGWDQTFHIKQVPMALPGDWSTTISNVAFHEGSPPTTEAWRKLCYFRSAYRNEPDFSIGSLGELPDISQRRFAKSIENDAAVSSNYRRLVLQTIEDVWGKGEGRGKTLQEYADEVEKKVNDSLSRVLPHLSLQSLGSPTSGTGNFYFSKGIAKSYLFKNLSGGEKAVFDLLIDLISKATFFDNSLICIDEPESHINPAVQGILLEELLSLTPKQSQLLVATHSIGMLRKARDIEKDAPGTVTFINFEADFDQPVILKPTKMDRSTWQRSLAVALDDLAALLSPKRIIICEGGSGDRFPDDALDAQVYNRIFSEAEPDTQFVAAGSHTETTKARDTLMALAKTTLPGLEVQRLIDRDDRSDDEVAALRKEGHRVLSLRNLESYLFSDEILGRLCDQTGRAEQKEEILKQRDAAIDPGRSNDLKPASGKTYVACKNLLGLQNPGNSAKSFMIEKLAPLVTRETDTFKWLHSDIFGSPLQSDLLLATRKAHR